LILEVLEGRQAPAALIVNSSADTANSFDPYLSLREAIAIVNSPTLPSDLSPQIQGQIIGTLHGGGADGIGFVPSGLVIVLAGTQLELSLPAGTAAVTIDGGLAGVTVDGHNASRIFQVDATAQASFYHVFLYHGRAMGDGPDNFGGGISNSGTLTLSSKSILSHNSAPGSIGGAGFGGGIYNTGTLTVTDDSTLSSNSAGDGGGISNSGGTVTLTDTTLSYDSAGDGGGISNSGGTVTLTDSTLSSSSADLNGGGIYNSGGTLTVTDTTLSSNFAAVGGGISNHLGTVALTGSTLSSNSGGGISNHLGTVALTGSTLSSNSASYGGGIYNDGALTVTDSSLTSNSAYSAYGDGGGIYNDFQGTLTLTDSTVSANSADVGGGIDNSSGATLVLQNTIVAGNRSSPNRGPDVNGSVQSSSYNLVGIADGTLSGISDGTQGNHVGTPGSPIDPRLAPLGDYGGPTQTMPPLAGSPALDAGDPAQSGTPDQRGVVRTGGVNIGSFQASAAYLVLSAPSTAQPGVPFDLVVAVYDAFGQRAVGYTGTVQFSTTDPDPNVVLPPDYTFQLSDGGTVTFSAGVTLYTAGDQTLTATVPDAGITGSTVVTL
jgi:hypothetical protein